MLITRIGEAVYIYIYHSFHVKYAAESFEQNGHTAILNIDLRVSSNLSGKRKEEMSIFIYVIRVANVARDSVKGGSRVLLESRLEEKIKGTRASPLVQNFKQC